MSAVQNPRLGIFLMIASCAVFSVQDVFSRKLAGDYNVYMVVMLRFWVFAAFVLLLAARAPGGLRAAARTAHPVLQSVRGLLLIAEIVVIVFAFTKLGLIETHAVFVCYPLLVAALSGPVLGEKVGWRRWSAILAGFVGVLIILQPGSDVFSIHALLPFGAALSFAVYGLLTRYVSRTDTSSSSLFWIAVIGAIAITPFGIAHWQPMHGIDWLYMAALCFTSILGHWLLIRAYDVAEASAVQPFAYVQVPIISMLGLLIFDESLRPSVVLGSAIVVAAGVFTLWRQRQLEKGTARR